MIVKRYFFSDVVIVNECVYIFVNSIYVFVNNFVEIYSGKKLIN